MLKKVMWFFSLLLLSFFSRSLFFLAGGMGSFHRIRLSWEDKDNTIKDNLVHIRKRREKKSFICTTPRHSMKTRQLHQLFLFTVWWQNSEASFSRRSGTKKCTTGFMLSIHSWQGRSGKPRTVRHWSCYDVWCIVSGEVGPFWNIFFTSYFNVIFFLSAIHILPFWEVNEWNLGISEDIIIYDNVCKLGLLSIDHTNLFIARSKLGRRSRHTSGGSHPNTLSVPTKWEMDNPRYKQSLSHWLLHQSLTSSTT